MSMYLPPSVWKERIHNEWYLVGLPGLKLDGLEVRQR